jgi:hypothetical protein
VIYLTGHIPRWSRRGRRIEGLSSICGFVDLDGKFKEGMAWERGATFEIKPNNAYTSGKILIINVLQLIMVSFT